MSQNPKGVTTREGETPAPRQMTPPGAIAVTVTIKIHVTTGVIDNITNDPTTIPFYR